MVKDQKQKMKIIIFFKLTRQLKNKESNMFFCLKIEKNRNLKNSHENSQKTSYKMSFSSCEDQRTDNSERRRKQSSSYYNNIHNNIREQITPKGDGNFLFLLKHQLFLSFIREQITPKGDGNLQIFPPIKVSALDQRTDNSERRRKRQHQYQ